ncbi:MULTISPECIES: DUF4893 domain-containing protein [unclassified Sphingomonas]|uniref:DUF4893 domain-containing protein n=1 Tax=unclassified Sphingomonas TaxID=196159 RepID=UPI0022B3293E|nr:DUF4893 domain-containing protein [Sphingomonas sp. NIBR02145]WHU00995.1 DUF4893 domain-containing protein [Sphingomonas sp. NIBR02145]
MKGIPAAAALLAIGFTTGCSVYRDATATRPPAGWSWRKVMTTADADRIRQWRRAWDDALAPAKAANPAAIAADPQLFDPDVALGTAMPPAGDYRCRTVKLGSQQPLTPYYAAYPAGQCRITVQGPEIHFVRLDGQQRPDGLLYPNTDARSMFIGVMVLGDETAPLRYGVDRKRDMIGYVERIGEKRWRLVLPYPGFESKLDVIELVPAG